MPRDKPNFNQIAELAGVSASTVDRVLNDRGGVSEARRKKVLEAARTLGTGRVLPSAVLGSMHFDIVRTKAENEFSRRMELALQRVAGMLGKSVVLHRSVWAGEDQSALVRFITRPRHRRHGLIMVAGDTPELRGALEQAVANGMPAVLMVNNLSGLTQQVPYVGVDNRAAGATAALLMGRFLRRQGRVLMLTGSSSFQPYRERSEGFMAVMERDFPGLELVGPVDMRDEEALAETTVRGCLRGESPLVGLYGNGQGSLGADRAMSRLRPGDRPIWITHESTPQHDALLNAGRIHALIDQDPETQALHGMQYLLHANHDGPAPEVAQTRFHIITAENIPQLPF